MWDLLRHAPVISYPHAVLFDVVVVVVVVTLGVSLPALLLGFLYYRPIVIACKSLNDVGALEEYKGVKCAPRKLTPSKFASNAIFG